MRGTFAFIFFAITGLIAVLLSYLNVLSCEEGKEIFDSTIDKYLVSSVVSPRLAGFSLKAFGLLLNTPILGSLVAYTLFKLNKLDLVQRFATSLPDDHIPFAYPQTALSPSDMARHLLDSEASQPIPEMYSTLVAARETGVKEGDFSGFSFNSASSYTSVYKSGSITPTQVIERLLGEIKRTNDTLRAWCQLNVEEILRQAAESTQRYRNNAPLSLLDGVPVTVKDEMAMKGYYTSYGTKIFKTISSEDAISVVRLKAAGAIIVGKTTMHELGLGTSGVSLPFGTPRNPYDPTRYPGGSSSGSAVAVASGLVPIAIDSDGGGSVRIPASLTGLYGLKATFGRIARSPRGVCYSVCHIGPLTANFEDLLLAYSVLAGPSDEDPFSSAQPPVHAASLTGDIRGLRIGVYEAHLQNSAPEVLQSVRSAISILESKGAVIVNISIPHLHIINKAHSLVITSEIGGGSFKHFKSHFFDYSPEVMLMFGLVRTYSSNDLIAAQRVRNYASRIVSRIFQQVDVMISPTNSHTAFPVPEDVTSYGESDVTSTTKQMAHAPLSNFVGYPSLTVPVGYTNENSLPIGSLIEADMWREDLLFKVARVLDESIVRKIRKRPKAYSNILISP